MTSYNVAIVGATGLVGKTVLTLLEERNFPINNLYLLGSQRSEGSAFDFKKKPHFIQNLEIFDFSLTQIAFFCVGNELAATYVPKAVAQGNLVLDKSSYFRYQPTIPLIVPEVNFDSLSSFSNQQIIANPNCSTIPIAVALKPIYDAVGITRINIATYQSVSGSGKDALTELEEQTNQLLNGESIQPKVYPHQIAFNVLPHIDEFLENGYTKEEMKIIWETQKLFNDETIAVNPTTVRVPVYYGHSAAVHIETNKHLALEDALSLLSSAPSVQLITGQYPYPTPAHHAAGKDLVYVGRVRKDLSHSNGINLWIVTDNIRKGAALNAIQIAEMLIKKKSGVMMNG